MIRKFAVRLTVWSVAIVMLVIAIDQARRWFTPPAPSAVIVDRLRATRELIGLVVEVAEPRVTTKAGKLGGIEVTLLVRGQCYLGVDLGQMTIASVDETEHAIVISLPPPTVRMARVDPERTLFLQHRRYGIWILCQVERIDRDVVATALADAQNVVQAAGANPQHQPAAKLAIEQALTDLATQAGWTIRVRWHSPPNGGSP